MAQASSSLSPQLPQLTGTGRRHNQQNRTAATGTHQNGPEVPESHEARWEKLQEELGGTLEFQRNADQYRAGWPLFTKMQMCRSTRFIHRNFEYILLRCVYKYEEKLARLDREVVKLDTSVDPDDDRGDGVLSRGWNEVMQEIEETFKRWYSLWRIHKDVSQMPEASFESQALMKELMDTETMDKIKDFFVNSGDGLFFDYVGHEDSFFVEILRSRTNSWFTWPVRWICRAKVIGKSDGPGFVPTQSDLAWVKGVQRVMEGILAWTIILVPLIIAVMGDLSPGQYAALLSFAAITLTGLAVFEGNAFRGTLILLSAYMAALTSVRGPN